MVAAARVLSGTRRGLSNSYPEFSGTGTPRAHQHGGGASGLPPALPVLHLQQRRQLLQQLVVPTELFPQTDLTSTHTAAARVATRIPSGNPFDSVTVLRPDWEEAGL